MESHRWRPQAGAPPTSILPRKGGGRGWWHGHCTERPSPPSRGRVGEGGAPAGGQHAVYAERDADRTAWLESQGFTVIRFWNNEVLGNPDGVLDRIRRALGGASNDPASSPPNRGGS